MDKKQLKSIIKEEYQNVKSFMEYKYGFTPELGKVISNPYAKSFVNEAKEPQIISDLRDVVKNGYKSVKDPVSGKKMKVDSYSASAVIAVYDALRKPNVKANFASQPLPKMVNVAFKVVKVKKESVNELLVIVDKFDKNKQDYGKIYYRDGGNKPGDGDINKAKKELAKLSKKHKDLTLVSIGRNSKMYDVMDESVNEAKVNYNFSEDELKRVLKLLGRSASTEIKMIKAFEKAFGRKLTRDEMFESVNEAKSMDMKKRLKVYDKLKKGDKITIKYGSSMRGGVEKEFVVSKGKTLVGKQKVERIILKNPANPKGVKYYLYQRNGNVTMAIGDMAATIEDMHESVNEAKEPEVITQLRKIVKDKQNALIKDTKSGKRVRVDMNSANLMVQIYDKLRKQSNKDNFVKSGIVMMGHTAYKLFKK